MRFVQIIAGPDGTHDSGLAPGEYAYLEFSCEDLEYECRQVFLQVVLASDPETILAIINYGWEKESYYRKRLPWDRDAAKDIVRGSLDLTYTQSEHAEALLALFHQHVLDESYRMRLRRHYRLFREAVERRATAN
jgi:hypothetical protein